MEEYRLLWIALVTLGASYLNSVTGFGFGIFAMIFLPSFLQYTEANALSSVLGILIPLYFVITMRKYIHWKSIVFPLIGNLSATYLAVSFIKKQENEILLLFLGISLFVFSMYFFFFSGKIKIKVTWYTGLIAGILSGVLSGMFSMGGPPVVVYFVQSEPDPKRYLATISSYFVFSGPISITSKACAGFYTANVWLGFAIGIVGILAGILLGNKTRSYIKPDKVKKTAYGVMAASGLLYVGSSLF